MTNLSRAQLIEGLDNLQHRFAAHYPLFAQEHVIRVSVSITDRQGRVSDTIQPEQPRSSREWWWWKTDRGLFADGIVFDNDELRIQAMYQVATLFWQVAGSRSDVVIDATFQDVTADGIGHDHVVQAYWQDGRLNTVEKEVEDRS